MPSVNVAYSQVAPFKRYIVDSSGALLYDEFGVRSGDPLELNVVLQDMGKTSVIDNGDGTSIVLKKVKVVPQSATQAPLVGYMSLDSAPGKIAALN